MHHPTFCDVLMKMKLFLNSTVVKELKSLESTNKISLTDHAHSMCEHVGAL